MAKVSSTSSLLRSLCSLMPISITLVSCSSAFTLPSARAAGGSPSASPGGRGTQAGQRSPPSSGSGLGTHHRVAPALSTRGGAEEERSAQGGCGVDKHSFRSTVRKLSHARKIEKTQRGRCAWAYDIAVQPRARVQSGAWSTTVVAAATAVRVSYVRSPSKRVLSLVTALLLHSLAGTLSIGQPHCKLLPCTSNSL